jgi:hypothetical protein
MAPRAIPGAVPALPAIWNAAIHMPGSKSKALVLVLLSFSGCKSNSTIYIQIRRQKIGCYASYRFSMQQLRASFSGVRQLPTISANWDARWGW